MYVTLKLDDNGCCRIHSISYDGNGWIVTNKRYVVMPWKMVTRNGTNMTLAEDVVKYVKKVKELIDKPLDEMVELDHVRLAMAKVKCPHKLDILVFYQLTRRLPHEDLNFAS